MTTSLIIMICTILVFVLLGFMMHKSIKKLDSMPKGKRKKGKMKYMPQSKNPGK